MGNCLWRVQDAPEELRLCACGFHTALLPEGQSSTSDLSLAEYIADLSPNVWIFLVHCFRSTWTHSAVAISRPLSRWSRSFFPQSSLHSTAFRMPATNIIMWTAVYWYVERCLWLMGLYSMFFLCRPDQAVFNGEDEDHLNSRDLSDEPWRRQVIANLAKHVLFSKGT